MTMLALAYVAGLLTIATPCIVPVLPFVLARGDEPFRRGGLPLLLGLIVAFAAVASLASVAGGWAVNTSRFGRIAAVALMSLFGLTMCMPTLAERLTLPMVSTGSRLLRWTGQRAMETGATTGMSMLIGVATGLVWAPCAGPVLGLILTGAALRGPGVATSLLLLTYGAGAATSLGAGLLFGRRLISFFRRSAPWGEGLRRLAGAAVIAGAVTIWFGLDTGLLTRLSSIDTDSFERHLIAIVQNETEQGTIPRDALLGAPQWMNTKPLRAEDMRGKVVLVNFWTYSCSNCVRTLPHIRAWSEKYKDRGLVVIGVHTPEYGFEKDVANVRRASASLGVSYPVVIDNDFGIWRAFRNRAWPAIYFIGVDGRIRHHVFGEGGYEASERIIEQLLSEANDVPAMPQQDHQRKFD